MNFLRWLRSSGMWPRLMMAAGNFAFAGLCLWAAYAIYHGQLL
ncbi:MULTISPECIES: hypothetical protein [Xanthomonas]|jgi:hypothetical protein|uniref:Uncharacterized protein n=1 Tax=Xanthomonas campestris pv. campestris TaxID=340 RepID=A0A0C7KFC4_XANCE|nr:MULTISPECIES: hypothetical protein [Xanthomonas]MDC8650325.1 hypothetical protein [Xanthomonas hortorum pv. pelargonii]MDC8654563.1 hypothetical protein [Xanthomonas hortorum pv. pelargonii]MDC8658819.1 hypothetical protein [Xanthomonas hortorum pv. pelargonii]MDC8675838.1 hypothetical protein [Xanthomonas hortorum pv. pelargonii]MDC8683632.1 hypothetical protein [Xanthomonas hortorum pv. pelargonii]